MKLKIHLPSEAWKLLSEMASKSELTPEELIQVATYNLIALYLRDKGAEIAKMDESSSDLSSNDLVSVYVLGWNPPDQIHRRGCAVFLGHTMTCDCVTKGGTDWVSTIANNDRSGRP